LPRIVARLTIEVVVFVALMLTTAASAASAGTMVATTRRWVRTRPSGTFTLSYRFLRTFRAASYRFRVVADEDRRLPIVAARAARSTCG
jgi:hypothetical protein